MAWRGDYYYIQAVPHSHLDLRDRHSPPAHAGVTLLIRAIAFAVHE